MPRDCQKSIIFADTVCINKICLNRKNKIKNYNQICGLKVYFPI